MEAPVCKVRRTATVVVDQPASDKILVDSMPVVSLTMEDVSRYVLAILL